MTKGARAPCDLRGRKFWDFPVNSTFINLGMSTRNVWCHL